MRSVFIVAITYGGWYDEPPHIQDFAKIWHVFSSKAQAEHFVEELRKTRDMDNLGALWHSYIWEAPFDGRLDLNR